MNEAPLWGADSNLHRFNTQTEKELGGCGSHHDLIGNFLKEKDVPIEIKKQKTPDWMQCSLKYDETNRRWIGSSKNKIPETAKKLFEDLVQQQTLFQGNIPPFLQRNITHDEWKRIKHETDVYRDMYWDCPPDTIRNLYRQKGCLYMQISDKGLYHLGEDPCGFGVPEFLCEQQLRIRTKIHTTRNAQGFCQLSVTVACQPKNIKKMPPSPYSLDDRAKLPTLLEWTG